MCFSRNINVVVKFQTLWIVPPKHECGIALKSVILVLPLSHIRMHPVTKFGKDILFI